VQYVEKKFIEVNYNMLIQNHVHYNYIITKPSYGLVVQLLKIWFLNVKVRNSSLHTCNIGYLGYLGDLGCKAYYTY